MNSELESILEPYLKKICEQNDAIIELLKGINGNSKKSNSKDENKKIVKEKMESLTKRERQIFELIMQGMLNKEMAYQLSLSLSTIEAHRSRIMKKMDVKNVAQLTKEYMIFQSLIKD